MRVAAMPAEEQGQKTIGDTKRGEDYVKNPVCFMACQPVEEDWLKEHFYVVAFPELTIYGHTIDRFTKEHYADDWSRVAKQRLEGLEWGCWHSEVCPHGEVGSQDIQICVGIPPQIFLAAREKDWPETDFITTPDPLARIYGDDGSGKLTEIWNSKDGGI